MCISDWLRRTFSAFCQYLFAKIYIIFIKIVAGSFLIPVTILFFLSLMTLPFKPVLHCSVRILRNKGNTCKCEARRYPALSDSCRFSVYVQCSPWIYRRLRWLVQANNRDLPDCFFADLHSVCRAHYISGASDRRSRTVSVFDRGASYSADVRTRHKYKGEYDEHQQYSIYGHESYTGCWSKMTQYNEDI